MTQIDPADLATLKADLRREIASDLKPPDPLNRPGPAEFFAMVRKRQASALLARREAASKLADRLAAEAARVRPQREELERELLTVAGLFTREEQRHAAELGKIRGLQADVNARLAELDRDVEARAQNPNATEVQHAS